MPTLRKAAGKSPSEPLHASTKKLRYTTSIHTLLKENTERLRWQEGQRRELTRVLRRLTSAIDRAQTNSPHHPKFATLWQYICIANRNARELIKGRY